MIILLAILFLGSPPEWVLGIGAGAGAVVAAVAVHTGIRLMPARLQRARGTHRVRWIIYVVAGAVATVALGPWLVLVLLGCGLVELTWRRATPRSGLIAAASWPLILAAAGAGGLAALCWTAFKVGALSYGGGFVIIPLMQADAVEHYRWMTDVMWTVTLRSCSSARLIGRCGCRTGGSARRSSRARPRSWRRACT